MDSTAIAHLINMGNADPDGSGFCLDLYLANGDKIVSAEVGADSVRSYGLVLFDLQDVISWNSIVRARLNWDPGPTMTIPANRRPSEMVGYDGTTSNLS